MAFSTHGTRFPACAKEKATAESFDKNEFVPLTQERERGVDQRRTSPIQITKTEEGIAVVVEET
jgi:hypothetical protein